MFGTPKCLVYMASQAVQALLYLFEYTDNPKGIVAGKHTVGNLQLTSKSNVKIMVLYNIALQDSKRNVCCSSQCR